MLRMVASVASKWWNNIIIILINIAFNCADELRGAEVNAERESIKHGLRLQLVVVRLADYIKKQMNNNNNSNNKVCSVNLCSYAQWCQIYYYC